MSEPVTPPLILIVEDDKSTRMVLRRIMEHDGWRAVEAEDGVAGVAACEQLRPDLILMDGMMPRMDGFEACEHITSQPANHLIPVLMVTALNDETSVDRAFAVGATDYLTKPLHLPVVRQRVRRLLMARESNLARAASEAALRDSEARFRGMFEESPISLWEEDFSGVKQRLEALRREGVTDFRRYFAAHPEAVVECMACVNVLAVNKATLRLYEAATSAELLGALGAIVPTAESSPFIDELVFIAAGRTEFEWEGVNLTLNGKRLNINLRWSAVPGYETTLEKVLVSVMDITARKQAEESIRHKSAELEAIFHAHPDLFFRLDPDGTVRQYYAPASVTLPRTVIGRHVATLLPPDIASRLPELIRNTLQSGALQTTEFALAAPTGGERIYEARFIPFLTEQVIAIVRDVTELKQMQERLWAGQKMADLGTLAAGVAHEINSPLQVITGVSHSLMARLEQNDLKPDYLLRNLSVIHRNGWRCAEIVRALRTYAHAAAAEFEPMDLNSLVRDVLLLVEHQLASWSNITIVTDFAEALPLFTCDRNQITQVLINLMTNARDAMPSGGEITLRTRYDAAAKRLCLHVRDSGDGIPEAIRAKIFDPFFTTKPMGHGTGLGLSIVQGIVRGHGGDIDVSSPPGEGATFNLYFPLTEPAPVAEDEIGPGRFGDSAAPLAAPLPSLQGG
jgi:PAS domain S-box-containing protein